MAIEKRMCAFHPDRLAIGVCVETKAPICGECSTRYEGVNYSKEGLRLMQARRAVKTSSGGAVWMRRALFDLSYSAAAVVCMYVLYEGYLGLFGGMTDLLYPSDSSTSEALHNLLKMLGQ